MKSLPFILLAGLISLPSFASPEALHFFATCYDQKDSTWMVRVEGSGRNWSARTTLVKGPINIINPSQGMVADQNSSHVNLIRNFMGFGQVAINIPLQKTAVVPFESLTLADGFPDENGAVSTVAFLRKSIHSSESETLKCETNKTEGWAEFIKQHDLQLLNEPAPASVCRLLYQKFGPSSEPEAACSGTLVGPRQLLTAGHCDLMLPVPAFVECPGEKPRAVKARKTHPKYRLEDSLSPYDVSIFSWEEPITSIAPVALAESVDETIGVVLNDTDSCRLYGYGTRSDRSFGKIGVAPLVPLADFAGGKKYMESQMRAGILGTDPEAFVRPGDSGGPVLCRGRGGRTEVVGVHSYIAVYDSSANSALVAYPENLRWLKSQLE